VKGNLIRAEAEAASPISESGFSKGAHRTGLQQAWLCSTGGEVYQLTQDM